MQNLLHLFQQYAAHMLSHTVGLLEPDNLSSLLPLQITLTSCVITMYKVTFFLKQIISNIISVACQGNLLLVLDFPFRSCSM
jgi:hypothetical protein